MDAPERMDLGELPSPQFRAQLRALLVAAAQQRTVPRRPGAAVLIRHRCR